MNNTIKSALALGLVVASTVLNPTANAEIHSKSKDLVVMEAHDLPEQAQVAGNSLFLHSDNAGSTYLYVEQQQGARLSVFDVTNPARIKLVVSTPLAARGVFDFVRSLGNNAELVHFRNGQKEAVLDLRKVTRPVFRVITAVTDFGPAEDLGESGLLVTNRVRPYVPAVAHDYQVIDISASVPTQLATIKDVKQRVTNDDTGTTFLLGDDGLTVVRRLGAEYDYQVHQMQMRGN